MGFDSLVFPTKTVSPFVSSFLLLLFSLSPSPSLPSLEEPCTRSTLVVVHSSSRLVIYSYSSTLLIVLSSRTRPVSFYLLRCFLVRSLTRSTLVVVHSSSSHTLPRLVRLTLESFLREYVYSLTIGKGMREEFNADPLVKADFRGVRYEFTDLAEKAR